MKGQLVTVKEAMKISFYKITIYGKWLVVLGLSEGPPPEPEQTNELFS